MSIKDSKKGLSTTVAIGAIVLVIIVVLAAWYLMAPKAEANETLIMGTTDSVETSLDPAQAYDFFAWTVIQATGCGLVQMKEGTPNGAGVKDIIPGLATKWESSADGKTWTFTLREGVKWSDGTEFDATHVKRSFDRGITMALPEGAFVGIGFDGIIESVEVVSKYQVKFHLKIAFAPFLSLMASQVTYIVKPDAPLDAPVAYVEGNATASSPMDLGPYTLVNWTRKAGKDYEMRFVANPNYWDKDAGLPKTKNFIIRFYADATALGMAIDAGEIDIAYRQLKSADIDNLKTKTNVKVWEGTGQFIQYIVFQNKIPPFDDPKVRRAIAAALNRTAIVQTVFLGHRTNLYSMIPNGMAWQTAAYKVLGDANYSFTKNTLNDATIYGGPYNENKKLAVDLWYENSGHYPQSPDIALVIKDSLEASGVMTVKLNGLDWPAYYEKRKEQNMRVYIYGWYPDYVDPDTYIYPFLHSKALWLFNNYNNSKMDSVVMQSRSTADATARENAYKTVQEIMVEDAPIVPMFQRKEYAVTKPNIKGVYLDIAVQWRLWLLYAE